ncbi:AP-5 complex subunit sigma-1 [Podargus strigoides]
MVRAFVLLALGGPDPPAPPGSAPCRVLYARTFGNPPGTPSGTPHRQRLRRKEQLLAVARQVASQCRLLQSSSGCSSTPQPLEDPQDSRGGLFQLPPGDPFPDRVTVAWLSILTLALVFICDPHENLSLAQITLRRLAPRLLPPQRLHAPGADVLLQSDVTDVLLDHLLPHGQMLFLNQRSLQALDRELGSKTSR